MFGEKISPRWRIMLAMIVGFLVMPLCIAAAVQSGGRGHGDYWWAKVLFPYTMLSTLLFHSITVPFISLAVAQMPIYGSIMGIAWKRDKLVAWFTVLLVVHFVTVLICFAKLKDF
jgi:hypothetical protein